MGLEVVIIMSLSDTYGLVAVVSDLVMVAIGMYILSWHAGEHLLWI